ncbi:hypothetical protein [Rhodococcus globerulus]|uniref:hypothetical protein n=1 Tax=Rhodococcus globerulus TaxID=33008 RepID=UPI000524021A|nr:hypothetical protein [Rhodococcus globerulus]PVX59725.1 hypothetical protein C8E04_6315 [Rhodococcus globerulus]
MEWFVSMWDERSGFRRYRGGHGSDRVWVIEQVVAAGRALAFRGDGSVVGVVGNAVIAGTPVDSIAFGDSAVSDGDLARLIGARFDRVWGCVPPT